MKKLLTGNSAVAYAVKACRVPVVAAYPITPQTTVVEKIAELVAAGEMPAKLIKVESEHSSMAACVGASAVGVRVFTATSSHGLAYMHEMLHWASGFRLPIVMVNCNRALAAPWNLGVDELDSLSLRDLGWLQFYCENGQEVFDTVVQAYRVAEEVSLPAMVNLDGFYVSHTTEPVDLPDQEHVDSYLPPRKPLFRLDSANPASYGGTTTGEEYTHFRYRARDAMKSVPAAADEAFAEFGRLFGREYDRLMCHELGDGTEVAVVAVGSVLGAVRQAVRDLRRNGVPVGMIKLRLFRPFPATELAVALRGVSKAVVIDRDVSLGTGGVLCQEVRAALFDAGKSCGSLPVFGFIAGLGGADITSDQVAGMVEYALQREKPPEEVLWLEPRS